MRAVSRTSRSSVRPPRRSAWLDAFASEVFGVSNSSNAAGAELMENVAQIASAAKSVLTENKKMCGCGAPSPSPRHCSSLSSRSLPRAARVVVDWGGTIRPGGALAAGCGARRDAPQVTRPLRLVSRSGFRCVSIASSRTGRRQSASVAFATMHSSSWVAWQPPGSCSCSATE